MVAILGRLESGAQSETTCNQALLLMIVSHVLFEVLYNVISFFEDYTLHQGLIKGFSKYLQKRAKLETKWDFFSWMLYPLCGCREGAWAHPSCIQARARFTTGWVASSSWGPTGPWVWYLAQGCLNSALKLSFFCSSYQHAFHFSAQSPIVWAAPPKMEPMFSMGFMFYCY